MKAAVTREGGFTLIEAMIVLAIVVILSAIAYPSYLDFIRKGWRTEARSALMQQMQQQERHYTMVGRYLRYEGDSGGGGSGGKYVVVSGNCEGRGNIGSCIRLTASLKPGLADPQVGALWIDSTGGRGCDGTHRNRCWQ